MIIFKTAHSKSFLKVPQWLQSTISLIQKLSINYKLVVTFEIYFLFFSMELRSQHRYRSLLSEIGIKIQSFHAECSVKVKHEEMLNL